MMKSKSTSSSAKRISNMTLLAMLLASSKKAQPAFVKAFSTSLNGYRTPAASMGLASNILLRNEEMRKTKSIQHPYLHFSTESSSKTSATVEEDLDSALDEILGSAFQEAGDNGKPTSDDVDEDGDSDGDSGEIPVDFTDPKFLSTSNPHWTKVGMDQGVIDILSGKGITRFTEVQGKAFEPVLAGKDVIGRSRTGTGKTIAFGLPSVHRLQKIAEEKGQLDSYGRRKRGRNVSMITLCPTRELARQVEEEIAQIARPMGLFTSVFHGGVSYDPQVRKRRRRWHYEYNTINVDFREPHLMHCIDFSMFIHDSILTFLLSRFFSGSCASQWN